MKRLFRVSMLLLLLCVTGAIFAQEPFTGGFIPAQALRVEVLNSYPHDTSAYTQGLLWYEGSLYESTGQTGESTLREVNPTTGEIIRSIPVTRPPEQLTGENPMPDYFAEGLERIGDQLIQLTYHEGEAFVYELESFEKVQTFTYEGQGWGLCYDGRYLYMTDSTQYISIRETDTFELIVRMLVTYNGQSLQDNLLNELECVGDSIYANLWQTDLIVEINKFTGNIISVIDASGLLTDELVLEIPGTTRAEDGSIQHNTNAVLNGIAYNPDSDTYFITGKNWPRMFEVRFVPAG